MNFKSEHTFDQRRAESERVRNKYPDRVPGMCSSPSFLLFLINMLIVICEKLDKSKMEVQLY